MAVPRQYWSGSTLVLDWELTDVDGNHVPTATVTGTVSLPDGTTAPMVVTHESAEDLFRAVYVVTVAGTHGWRLEASGAAVDAQEGVVVAQRSLVGLPPINDDPDTDIGMVRTLTTDLDQVTPLLSDAQIQGMLTMSGSRIRRAAAMALDTIASSEALVSKRIKTLDLTTDGPAVARALREHAQRLRDEDDQFDDDGPWGIDIVNYDPWAAYRDPEGV